jgi:C4-type Zn-finger protein
MVKEVTMAASAEIRTTATSHQKASGTTQRSVDLPTCPVCADTMIAAESSAFLADNVVSYLWTCDTCGYGFVTNHTMKKITCS